MPENRFHTNNAGQYRYFRRPSLHDPAASGSQIFEIPRENQVKGDIRLGYIKNSNIIFGILLKELTRHLLVCGSSGAGKSNFLRIQ